MMKSLSLVIPICVSIATVSIFLFSIVTLRPALAVAATVEIGIVGTASEFDLANGDGVLERLGRGATTMALTRVVERNGRLDYELLISDSLRTDASLRQWSFHIPRSVQFSNAELMTTDDVAYSLERCSARERFRYEVRVGAESSARPTSVEWVSVVIAPEIETRLLEELPIALANCAL